MWRHSHSLAYKSPRPLIRATSPEMASVIDLVLVVGISLKVAPVSEVSGFLPIGGSLS